MLSCTLLSELATELTNAVLAQHDKCVCITQISQTQRPAALPAELLSASPAKQPEAPESQEQLQHKTQQPLCDLLQLFRAEEIRGLYPNFT